MPLSARKPLEFAFGITLHVVQTAPYRLLNLEDLVFPFWIVSHILQGTVTTETAGLKQISYPGDVMIHPPHIPFSEQTRGPGIHQWMGFDARGSLASGEGIPAGWDMLAKFPVSLVVPLGSEERRERFASVFNMLESAAKPHRAGESLHDSPGRILRAAALCGAILGEVIDAWAESGAPARPAAAQSSRDRFAGVIAYMERNLVQRITRDDLAAEACLHPVSLDRAFRAVCGVPPMRLLQDMRLQRVRMLLRSTDNTLETIARSCGMGDAARLSRTFRASTGQSPGAWRIEAARLNSTTTGYIPPLSEPGAES